MKFSDAPHDMQIALKKDLLSAMTSAELAETVEQAALAVARYKAVCDFCHTFQIPVSEVAAFALPADPPHYVSHENGVRMSGVVRVF